MDKRKLILMSTMFFLTRLSYSQVNSLSSINEKDGYIFIQTTGIISDVWFKQKNNFFSVQYENPNCGDFLIQSSKLARKKIQSYLLNINGVVVNEKMLSFDSDGFASFTNSSLPQGFYIVQIKHQGKFYSNKLIIQCD